MANTYLGNAFSLQMVAFSSYQLSVQEVEPTEVGASDFVSCIGHIDTAAVVSSIIGKEVPMNRINVSLEKGDTLYVAQVVGGRLPEGTTTLPEGFKIVFRKVELV